MKIYNTLAVAVAAVLGLSATGNASDDSRHHHSRAGSERSGNSSYAVRQYADNDRWDELSTAARIASWPYRAARTVVRSPIIVGETLSGRREVRRADGRFLARGDNARSERVSLEDRSRVVARRSGDLLEDSGRTAEWVVRRGGETIGDATAGTARFARRTGRTILRSPTIIGETLTGDREIISRNGRVLSRNTRDGDDSEGREVVQRRGRGQSLYASQ